MLTLIFKNSKLQGILRITQQSKTFIASFGEAVKAYEKNTKKRYKHNINIDNYYEHTTPTIWLVKDAGIYLMTSAKMDSHPQDFSHVCYAEGFNPESPNCWEKCRAAVGGDDFVESFKFDNQLKKALEEGADIHIRINKTSFTVNLVYP